MKQFLTALGGMVLGGIVVFAIFHFRPEKLPHVVVSQDPYGRTICDVHKASGLKWKTITFYKSYAEDRDRDPDRSLAWTEDTLNEKGESVDTRWFNGLGKMYMWSQTLGKDNYLTTTYRKDGTMDSLSKSEPGKLRTHIALLKDGKSARYEYTNAESPDDPDHCRVFVDWQEKPCDLRFSRKHLYDDPKQHSIGVSEGDPPKAMCVDTYTRSDGSPTYRQTWFMLWEERKPDEKRSRGTYEALGKVEIFDFGGERVSKRIHLVPQSAALKPLFKEAEFIDFDGSKTVYTFNKEGALAEVKTVGTDGKEQVRVRLRKAKGRDEFREAEFAGDDGKKLVFTFNKDNTIVEAKTVDAAGKESQTNLKEDLVKEMQKSLLGWFVEPWQEFEKELEANHYLQGFHLYMFPDGGGIEK
jgi:hypothetical protein